MKNGYTKSTTTCSFCGPLTEFTVPAGTQVQYSDEAGSWVLSQETAARLSDNEHDAKYRFARIADDNVQPLTMRKDYLDGNATFAEYYGEVITAAKCRASFSDEFKALLRAEFDKGNTSFNRADGGPRDFDLSHWDAMVLRMDRGSLDAELRKRGDYTTQAGLVCVIKELARMAIGERHRSKKPA
jgi:hypothetical protein